MTPQFTLTAVQPQPHGRLHLEYADGGVFDVDIKPVIRRSRVFAPLKETTIFATARLGDHGAYVAFADDDDLELGADNLRARAIEQQGGYSHEYLYEWMARHGLTQHNAANALGISRRMLGYYLSGAKPLPLTVALACLGWESQQRARAA